MKKFALLVYNDSALFDALPAAQYESRMRSCLTHADELRAAGQLHDSQMLEDAHTARAVRVRSGRLSITDGPFTETKELLAGFNLIEAENIEEAVRIATEFPWIESGCIEVREIRDIATVRESVFRSSSPRVVDAS